MVSSLDRAIPFGGDISEGSLTHPRLSPLPSPSYLFLYLGPGVGGSQAKNQYSHYQRAFKDLSNLVRDGSAHL